MAKKNKKSPLLGVVVFLIAASFVSAAIFGQLYFRGYDALKDSDQKLLETKQKHDKLLADISDLQGKLGAAENEKRQLESSSQEKESTYYSRLIEKNQSSDCLLASPDGNFFGLASLKAYYRKIEKVDSNGQIIYCPAITIMEADASLLESLKAGAEKMFWLEKIDGVEQLTALINYGNIPLEDKNKIRSSMPDSLISLSLLLYEAPATAPENDQCFSPWRILDVNK